jgi:hypothetical protein
MIRSAVYKCIAYLNFQITKVFIRPPVKYCCEAWQFGARDKRKMETIRRETGSLRSIAALKSVQHTGSLGKSGL